jgi:hypothetical protein
MKLAQMMQCPGVIPTFQLNQLADPTFLEWIITEGGGTEANSKMKSGRQSKRWMKKKIKLWATV